MLAVVAPGQGAQTPGFLAPWLADPAVTDQVTRWSELAGLDLAALGTEADADTIRDTAVAQPLLVTAALVAFNALGASPDVVAGHSVGELPAAAWAGVLGADEAISLVAVRARAMAEAAAAAPTSMTAVLGGQPEEVLAAIEAAGLTAANNNGSGQIVAAGTVAELAAFAEAPPARARLIPLSVAGAFHTSHMAPAVERLRAAAADVTPGEPTVPLLSNADGAVVTSGADALDRIVGQVAHPVRWDRCLATLGELGVTGLLEVAPAGTLTGIAKRNLKGVELFGLNSPDQLSEAREFAGRHATT